MPDYSKTPLVTKLGMKLGSRLLLINPPQGFVEELGTLPPDATLIEDSGDPLDIVLLFVEREGELRERFELLAARLIPTGMLWVAWPKKASKVPTDLTFEIVQPIGLATGLVDNKMCAINAIWTGLRFVVRVENRPRVKKRP
ncbi:MAG: DUF3052 domain-containing protein [Chloroflexota bacterium]